MTFKEFKTEYVKTFNFWMSYTPDQVGSQYYAEKMADLEEINPEWTEIIENEMDN